MFQFYPENPDQVELIVGCAMKAGFTGGLVVDYPNSTKAKKYFLCLFAGYKDSSVHAPKMPVGLTDENGRTQVSFESSRRGDNGNSRSRKRAPIKDKNWVQKKKEVARKRGKDVAKDSKFTARKRRPKF